MGRILGIDPGLTGGGFAVVDTAGPPLRFRLLSILDIPTMGEEHRKRVDVKAVARWLEPFAPDRAIIERAQSMPYKRMIRGQAVMMPSANSFKYGRAVGYIEACVIMMGIPLSTVEPAVWKRFYNLPGGPENKRFALSAAQKYFGAEASEAFFKRQKDHNRAEAALIARFGALHLSGDSGEKSAPEVRSRPQDDLTLFGGENDGLETGSSG